MAQINKNFPQRLGVYTQKVVQPVFKTRGLMEGKIITHWSTIVGEKISQLSLVEKITFPKGKKVEGTLHLRVTSSGACLLQYAQDLVLERVNIFFGYKALSKLQMTHDLVHLKPSKDVQQTFSLSQEEGEWLKSLIEDIQDQELKTHLENLGKGICHLKKT